MSSKRPSILAVVAALVVGAAVGLWVFRDPAPPLTAESLAAARSRWGANEPMDYAYELEMRGALEERRRVEVRGGEVVRMTSAGAEVPPQSWGYWTMEGLFGFLEDEIANAADPRFAYGVDDPARIVLSAEFDGRRGYPRRFLRHVMGSTQSVEWEMVAFELP